MNKLLINALFAVLFFQMPLTCAFSQSPIVQWETSPTDSFKRVVPITPVKPARSMPGSTAATTSSSMDQPVMVRCAPQLQSHLNSIQKIPEAKALIEAIQKEGPIQIVVKNTNLSNQFGAYWDP